MSEANNDVMYGGPEDEALHCYTLDEYIEQYLDDTGGDFEKYPSTLKVVRYERLKISEETTAWHAERMLEDLIEVLDENYGGPDEYTEETDAMKAAALEFLRVVVKEYRVWQCEPAETIDVDVAEWRRNNPDAST